MNRSRFFPTAVALSACLVLGACAGKPGNMYPGAAEQMAQRSAAESQAGEAAQAPADSRETYLGLVAQMQRDGLWFASLAHLDALEKRWGVAPASVRLRADALRRTDQPDAAREAYGRLIGTPFEGAGYHGLGLIAASRGEDAESVRLLSMARQIDPTHGALLNDLGYAHLRAGRIAEARVPLMQAMQLRPDDPQVQVNVALYLQASGQATQADAMMAAYGMASKTRIAVRNDALPLIELQRNGSAASATPRPIAGDVADMSYQRYLDTFKRPIPERFGTTVPGPASGGRGP
jgi:Flp pilus assembly protein TadD